MKSDLHKSMYKEMLGHLIKKMRKGMVGDAKKDGVSMNMSEGDVMEDKDEDEEEMESDFASPEELSDYLKPKKKKVESEGVAFFGSVDSKSSKPKGVPFKKSSKY